MSEMSKTNSNLNLQSKPYLESYWVTNWFKKWKVDPQTAMSVLVYSQDWLALFYTSCSTSLFPYRDIDSENITVLIIILKYKKVKIIIS